MFSSGEGEGIAPAFPAIPDNPYIEPEASPTTNSSEEGRVDHSFNATEGAVVTSTCYFDPDGGECGINSFLFVNLLQRFTGRWSYFVNATMQASRLIDHNFYARPPSMLEIPSDAIFTIIGVPVLHGGLSINWGRPGMNPGEFRMSTGVASILPERGPSLSTLTPGVGEAEYPVLPALSSSGLGLQLTLRQQVQLSPDLLMIIRAALNFMTHSASFSLIPGDSTLGADQLNAEGEPTGLRAVAVNSEVGTTLIFGDWLRFDLDFETYRAITGDHYWSVASAFGVDASPTSFAGAFWYFETNEGGQLTTRQYTLSELLLFELTDVLKMGGSLRVAYYDSDNGSSRLYWETLGTLQLDWNGISLGVFAGLSGVGDDLASMLALRFAILHL